MAEKMIEGIWRSNEKNGVAILWERDDGSRYSSQSVKGDANWNTFFEIFKPEDVDKFTKVHQERRNQRKNREGNKGEEKKRMDKVNQERRKAADELESLFRAKLEAFEIPEVRDSENRELRSRIRKSKSLTELYSITAALIATSVIQGTNPESIESSANTAIETKTKK